MRAFKVKGEEVGLAALSKEDLPLFVKWMNDSEVTIYADFSGVVSL